MFYILTALFWFSLYAYTPIISPYSQHLNASIFLTGLIAGSYGFTQMILRIPLGIFSDITKKKKIFIILGVIIAVISGLGMFLFPNRYALLFFRGLSGVAASTWVIFAVLFSSYFKADESMKAIGILNSANSIGIVAALIMGGIAANVWGARYSFLLAAAVGLTALFLCFKIDENNETLNEPLNIKEMLYIAKQDKNLIKVSFLAIISQYVLFATTYGFTPIVADVLGADSFQLGLLSTIATIPGFFIAPIAGTVLLRKFKARNIIVIGFVLSALACIAVPYSANLQILFITQFIGGIGRNLIFPLLMGLSIRDVPKEKRATAMGFFQAAYGIGMFFGPSITGFIGGISGINLAFIITGVIGFIGAAGAWVIVKEN